MPIEILELTVRARVNEPQPTDQQQPNSDTGKSQKSASLETIERAVEEVMEILKRKNER